MRLRKIAINAVMVVGSLTAYSLAGNYLGARPTDDSRYVGIAPGKGRLYRVAACQRAALRTESHAKSSDLELTFLADCRDSGLLHDLPVHTGATKAF